MHFADYDIGEAQLTVGYQYEYYEEYTNNILPETFVDVHINHVECKDKHICLNDKYTAKLTEYIADSIHEGVKYE